MAKVCFVADQVPTGIDGSLMLSIVDGKDKVKEFLLQLRSKRKQEQEAAREAGRTPEPYLLQCELGVSYRQRTMNQNNLQWELCTRIAAADHVEPETVHQAMKEIVYPREEHYGAWIPKDGSELSTPEYSKAIDWLIHACIDRPDPVDIRDIWILFTQWRYQQERDPIHYVSMEAYREAHPCCEVCGKFLLQRNNTGEYQHIGHLSHIVSRGAGGVDEDWAVLIMCAEHHIQDQHQEGWEKILAIAPWLRRKVEAARNRVHHDPRDIASTVETVKEVFGGTVVSGEVPTDVQPSTDPDKQKMFTVLDRMKTHAETTQQQYYPKHDPKPDQYKDGDLGLDGKE